MGCDPIIMVGVDHRYELNQNILTRTVRNIRNRIVKPLRGGAFYAGVRAYRREKRRKRGEALDPIPPLWNIEEASGPTHFDDRYTAGEPKLFNLPQPEEAEHDFRFAARWAKEAGRQILDASPDTALHTFSKIPFDSLF
jgi:hypothetical protein